MVLVWRGAAAWEMGTAVMSGLGWMETLGLNWMGLFAAWRSFAVWTNVSSYYKLKKNDSKKEINVLHLPFDWLVLLEGFVSAKLLVSEQTDSGEGWECQETGDSASSFNKKNIENKKQN